MNIIVIIITILTILLNIYIVLNKNGKIETFVDSSITDNVDDYQKSKYISELESSYNYKLLEDDVKRELMSLYDVYDSDNLRQHNKASVRYNLTVNYPNL